MAHPATLAVIGGGPAGSMAATTLLSNGRAPISDDTDQVHRLPRVMIFEERPGWEKPCGGGLSHKALKRYPFLNPSGSHIAASGGVNPAPEAAQRSALQRLPQPLGNPISKMEVYAPEVSKPLRLDLREPLAIYSRSDLNTYLSCRAENAGAEVIHDRIGSVTRSDGGWEIRGRRRSYRAEFVILAAGARSRLRDNLAGPLNASDFMLTFGYYLPLEEAVARIEFFKDFEGYAWSFPRKDHLSVGICGKAGETKMPELRRRLGCFMSRLGYSAGDAPVFAHLLPSLDQKSWSALRIAGPGWALAGDLSGLVDPVTGEGIYFALRSAELLAELILSGAPESYPKKVWAEFGSRLAVGASLCRKFYCGNFWGAPSTARMVQFARRSHTFRELFQDLLEGAQSYGGLSSRLYRTLPKSLMELAAIRH